MCSELIFRCYSGRLRTNVIHLKKVETLPTLFGTSKAPPSHRPSQQRQLLPKHYWMQLAVAALQSAKHAVGTRCSCNRAGLSCTDYCKCEGGDICCSPFISKQLDIEDDEGEPSVDDE